ncbi:MAG: DUF2220 domain-containing protein [Lachnospiraceae bacterium]|nr:DUF2220 domain-containing protein [Lachnospiraceae bacterium]
MSNDHIRLNKRQKEILSALLDKFESSKTYREENTVNQSFKVKPNDFFKEYDSDFANLDEQEDFERDLRVLEEAGYVALSYKRGVISDISMVVSARDCIYSQLGRRELKQLEEEQISLYESFMGREPVLNNYCFSQVIRLQNRKKAEYPIATARELIKLLEFIENNSEEILERELSIELFGDSKVFEREYRHKLITVLKKYGNLLDIIENTPDDREQEHAILAEYNIYPNPTYVNFKGNGEVLLKNGNTIKLMSSMPIAIDADTLNQIDKVKVEPSRVVTVENLTSFNRMTNDADFYIYLAGYHNTAKQLFLQKIAASNSDKEWYHFGDIDPDGFFILEHLKSKTGIAFKQLYMSVHELKRYETYCKPLEDNDVKKAKTLLDRGLYVEEVQYMLANNVKLEQEVISWKQK